MTATALQQVTTEDVKQGILALIRENNAEFKAFLGEVLPKKEVTSAPKKEKSKASIPIVIVQDKRVPYSEMPFWKANPHFNAQALAFIEKNTIPPKGDFATAMKKAQEAFSDLDVTDEEWLLQIQD